MSSSPPIITSSSTFQLIIDALIDYSEKTGVDLANNPFADKLQLSKSPDDILQLLQERENTFKEYRKRNRTLINCLSPAVRVLHAFSATLGEALSLSPFPPAKAIFVAVDVLLAAASGVSSSYDALLDLFEYLGNFVKRLEVYTNISPTPLMTDIIIKIMVKLLDVLALATKKIKQGRFVKFAKKLLGENEVEAVLLRLDRLTQQEALMAVTQTLGVVYDLVNNMRIVLEDGKASTDSIRQELVALRKIVDDGTKKTKRDQLQRDVQRWLSPPDPSTNHNFVWEAHKPGTAEWFLQSNVLTEWKAKGSLLWIHGKPGSGKSTLLSAIIQEIEEITRSKTVMASSLLLCPNFLLNAILAMISSPNYIQTTLVAHENQVVSRLLSWKYDLLTFCQRSLTVQLCCLVLTLFWPALSICLLLKYYTVLVGLGLFSIWLSVLIRKV